MHPKENESDLTKRQIKKAKKIQIKQQKYFQKYGVTIEMVNDALAKKQQKFESQNSQKNTSKNILKSKKIEKNKSFFRVFLCHKWMLFWCALLSIMSVCLGFFGVPALSLMSNYVFAGEWNLGITWALILLALYLSEHVVEWVLGVIMAKLNCRVALQIRDELSRRVVNTQSRAYRTLTTGEIVQKSTSDPARYVECINSAWLYISQMLADIGCIAYFFVLNVGIGSIMVALMLVNMCFYLAQLKWRAKKAMRGTLINEKKNSAITEFVRGSDDVKSLNLKNSLFGVLSDWNKKSYNTVTDFEIFNVSFNKLRNVLLNIMIVGLMIFTIWQISVGVLSAAIFVVLLRYINVPRSLSNMIGRLGESLQDARIASRRMQKVFSDEIYPQEHFGTQDLADFTGKIEFRDVSFSYDEQIVLDHVNFCVCPNQTVGIVGKSGEGKSTILGLINRLYDCQDGEILLDGVRNTELTESALRSNVGLVPQNPYIFNNTIRQNLLYACPSATESELLSALKAAQFYDFVMQKPDGLDTFVGEGGIVLSGGQRQRLAIARAFLTKSRVLMLDEATSALDNQNQEGIKKVIQEMRNTRSFVIVAHRLSTIVDCDNILVLDGHKIVAQGKHNDLLRTCTVYQELYRLEKTLHADAAT